MATKSIIEMVVNGDRCEIAVQPYDSLNSALRDTLGLTGTKRGCDTGGCGACTVLVDNRAIYSCMYPARRAAGRKVTTIEGIGRPGSQHPMQQAFIENGGIQCGYCSPGMILAAIAILEENPGATEDDVREELAGNLCRCTGYVKIIESVLKAAGNWKAGA